MSRFSAAAIAAAVAHGLAWVAFLFLAFWPAMYQGVEVQPQTVPREATVPLELAVPSRSVTKSLVEVNGVWVLLPLLVPVLLTGAGLAAGVNVASIDSWSGTKPFLWIVATLLLALCVISGFSIGIFYLPAAVALLVAAALAGRSRQEKGRTL